MTIHRPTAYFILVGITVLFSLGITWKYTSVVNDIANRSTAEVSALDGERAEIVDARDKKPEKRTAKGIYLTAYSAGSEKKVDAMIDLINQTELNAVVIDIKDYSGLVLYDSNVPLVNELDLEDDRIGDVAALIDKLHEHDIYVIARQTVFQDPILARKKSEWAIHARYGSVWHDNKGLAWVDPTAEDVWGYNVAIAKEAIALGFDEINFDYVRFPSDGNLSQVVYTNGDKSRSEVMGEFFAFLDQELSDEPAWISIDMFGFVMERHDGISIGQRLEDAVDHIDYISPMMYPSHYPSGHLGLLNPAANPGAVIENGMQKGIPYFEGKRASVRPWIQAFHLGATYDASRIRAQIDMVEKYSDAGWLMWNAANRYSIAGLVLEEKNIVD
jgi:hypothetical protein